MVQQTTETLGDRLRRYRSAKGLTQTELAERAKVSRASIASWEGGTRSMRMGPQVRRLARVLGVTIEDLVSDAAA
jgi:transcriptional regulator with XRE-family HTH domain